MLICEPICQEISIEELVEEIESMRGRLVALGTAKGFQNKEVLFVSQQLDGLVNYYYRLTEEQFPRH